MRIGVLLDTGFLISLVDPTRQHHGIAEKYYLFLLGQSVPMYFSAIVAAELSIKQEIKDFPLNKFRVIPFNLTHAIKSAAMWNLIGARGPEDTRTIVRDDVKIMAQAAVERIPFILTEDAKSLYKYCEKLRKEGHLDARAIRLVDGFDPSLFREDGQRPLALSQS